MIGRFYKNMYERRYNLRSRIDAVLKTEPINYRANRASCQNRLRRPQLFLRQQPEKNQGQNDRDQIGIRRFHVFPSAPVRVAHKLYRGRHIPVPGASGHFPGGCPDTGRRASRRYGTADLECRPPAACRRKKSDPAGQERILKACLSRRQPAR